MKKSDLQSRIIASSLLVAIGDALGMPVEKKKPQEIAETYGRITTYLDVPEGHDWHGAHMKKGMTTDDKQLQLVMEQSLIRCKGVDMDDIAKAHVIALKESIAGWGGSTTKAVQNLQNGVHWSQSGIPDAAGNGISMKISSLGLLLAIKYIHLHELHSPAVALKEFEKYQYDFQKHVVDISRMTHQSRMAIASGLAQSYAVYACIVLPKEHFEEKFLEMVINACSAGEWLRYNDNIKDKLSVSLRELRDTQDYKLLSIPELVKKYGGEGRGRFYVLNSLSLTYALFLRNPYSMETVFDAVNAGGDTDTNASMVGALLGARNGMQMLDEYQYLIDGLWKKEEVIASAENFCETFILQQEG